jgi:hypothetical protein
MKRSLSVTGSQNKRSKNGELIVPDVPANLPPIVQPPAGNILPGEKIPEDLNITKLPPGQRREIARIKKFLNNAYADAPAATDNRFIHNLLPYEWGAMRFDPGNKSLPYILHVEEGWTESWLIKRITASETPFRIYPLSRQNSTALFEAVHHRQGLNKLRDAATFDIDVPEAWLGLKLKYKEFGKKGGEDFAKYLVAKIAFNQSLFVGKPAYWFRALCDEINFPISKNFYEFFLIVLFVVCADPQLIYGSTEGITGTWGTSKNRNKVKKLFIQAAKTAEAENKVKYKNTFNFLKSILPSVLC